MKLNLKLVVLEITFMALLLILILAYTTHAFDRTPNREVISAAAKWQKWEQYERDVNEAFDQMLVDRTGGYEKLKHTISKAREDRILPTPPWPTDGEYALRCLNEATGNLTPSATDFNAYFSKNYPRVPMSEIIAQSLLSYRGIRAATRPSR